MGLLVVLVCCPKFELSGNIFSKVASQFLVSYTEEINLSTDEHEMNENFHGKKKRERQLESRGKAKKMNIVPLDCQTQKI